MKNTFFFLFAILNFYRSKNQEFFYRWKRTKLIINNSFAEPLINEMAATFAKLKAISQVIEQDTRGIKKPLEWTALKGIDFIMSDTARLQKLLETCKNLQSSSCEMIKILENHLSNVDCNGNQENTRNFSEKPVKSKASKKKNLEASQCAKDINSSSNFSVHFEDQIDKNRQSKHAMYLATSTSVTKSQAKERESSPIQSSREDNPEAVLSSYFQCTQNTSTLKSTEKSSIMSAISSGSSTPNSGTIQFSTSQLEYS